MAIYGTEIGDEDLVQYMDEIANETLIPEEDLVNASGPSKEEIKDSDYGTDGIINDAIPSNIPHKIDRLYKIRNPIVTDSNNSEEISELLLLKNTMTKDIVITDNYNGICVDLNTVGYNLKIDTNCTLVAL